jgi:hypothetical protein
MNKKYLILPVFFSLLTMFSTISAQTQTSAQTSANTDYQIGELVEAADYRGAWYKSKIVEFDNSGGKYQVHFFGWDEAWDEWVTPDKIRYSDDYEFGREVEVSQNGVWYQALLIDSRYGSEHLVTYVGYNEDEWVKDDRIREIGSGWSYRRGSNVVEVQDGKKWRRAQILKRRYREVYVHYEGFDDVWNEWISEDKIRRIN